MRKPHPHYACTSKKVYASYERAAHAARYVMRRHNNRKRGCRLSPYRCPFCAGWHLTSREDE